MIRDALLEAVRRALREEHPALARLPLEPLRDKGLAHDHVRLVGSGLLARLPKQSQMGLSAAGNLAHQRACFKRAGAGGHVPRLAGVIAPSSDLPRGGLLVEEIIGRPVKLPQDLTAIATTLASLHALPLPPVEGRAPLSDAADPVASLQAEIHVQAGFLDQARIEAQSLQLIHAALKRLDQRVATPSRPPKRLISFDAHPGNYVVDPSGRAVLVDLEKARYSHAALDLAHATLVTSTTWDVDTSTELTPAQVRATYLAWMQAMGADGETGRDWLLPLREAMWLWSVTWCAKWQVISARDSAHRADGEDWSAERSDATLVRHVRDRVQTFLSPRSVVSVRDELAALRRDLS